MINPISRLCAINMISIPIAIRKAIHPIIFFMGQSRSLNNHSLHYIHLPEAKCLSALTILSFPGKSNIHYLRIRDLTVLILRLCKSLHNVGDHIQYLCHCILILDIDKLG